MARLAQRLRDWLSTLRVTGSISARTNILRPVPGLGVFVRFVFVTVPNIGEILVWLL